MDYLLVVITLPARCPAAAVVRGLLERRVIAGANLLPDLLTWYADETGLHETREVLLLCRTLPEQVASIQPVITEQTGETEFEISVVPATAGNPRYTDWIRRTIA